MGGACLMVSGDGGDNDGTPREEHCSRYDMQKAASHCIPSGGGFGSSSSTTSGLCCVQLVREWWDLSSRGTFVHAFENPPASNALWTALTHHFPPLQSHQPTIVSAPAPVPLLQMRCSRTWSTKRCCICCVCGATTRTPSSGNTVQRYCVPCQNKVGWCVPSLPDMPYEACLSSPPNTQEYLPRHPQDSPCTKS